MKPDTNGGVSDWPDPRVGFWWRPDCTMYMYSTNSEWPNVVLRREADVRYLIAPKKRPWTAIQPIRSSKHAGKGAYVFSVMRSPGRRRRGIRSYCTPLQSDLPDCAKIAVQNEWKSHVSGLSGPLDLLIGPLSRLFPLSLGSRRRAVRRVQAAPSATVRRGSAVDEDGW